MILAIDVGNTNIVVGGLRGFEEPQDTAQKDIIFTERLSTDMVKTSLEYAILFRTALQLHKIETEQIEGAIISSVVPPLTPVIRSALRKITGMNALILGPGIRTGLNIRIDDPATVGADLVAGAVVALACYKPPLSVIDLGTATTLMVVDQDSNYIGGAIMPGVRLSLSSLVSNASMLQGITLDIPKKAIGRNTQDAMNSGILFGHAAMIDGLLDRFENEVGSKLTVIATGGLAGKVIPACRHEIIRDDGLLLTGLRVIYERNRRHEKKA